MKANNTLLFWVCVAMGAGCSESDSQEPQSPAPDAMLQADMSTADVSVVDVSMMDNDAQIVDLGPRIDTDEDGIVDEDDNCPGSL